MNSEIYYHILAIGVLYEKGAKKGSLWRFKERKRLQEECSFWKKIMRYISEEKAGTDRTESLFVDLQNICGKYYFPNYERVLERRSSIKDSGNRIKIRDAEEEALNSFITELLMDFEESLNNFHGKKEAYCILEALHNLPKVFYGNDVIGDNKPLRYDDAVEYAGWAMPDKMKEKYKGYLVV